MRFALAIRQIAAMRILLLLNQPPTAQSLSPVHRLLRLVGIALVGVRHVEEQGRDEEHGEEQHCIENHEVLMWIGSFSAHNSISFCKTIKKTGNNCGTE